MRLQRFLHVLLVVLALFLAACATAPQSEGGYDPATLQFEGEAALETEALFVTQFPYRHSGQPNNRLAADWVQAEFSNMGLVCTRQEWQVINYSQPLPLNNVVCELPGQSGKQLVMMAHHDQYAGTVYGADNDGSGIAIMLELAQIFATEGQPAHSLVFVSTDGEEYGMLGAAHYIETHAQPDQIIAAFSLDNLGKMYYDGVRMSATGQLSGVGPLWLQLLAQDAARTGGDIWVPMFRSTVDQAIAQAVPISQWDQGPLVAAGVPALGFGASCPEENVELCWDSYHTPLDTLDIQSATTLHNSGRIMEATLRQMLAMDQFPLESGPYLYFEESNAVLRGPVLWLIFAAFVGLFFCAAWWINRGLWPDMVQGWFRGLPHFVGLWLPWVASALLLYIFVELGLMLAFDTYPAVAKDPVLFEPRWPAVALYVFSLVLLFWLGRQLARRLSPAVPLFRERQSLAFLIIGLAGLYIMIKNPFALMFLVPLVFWFLIRGRSGAGRIVDWLLYLLGGLVVFVLLYFFGALILRNDFAVLWYVLMMFSIRMVGFWSMAMITAVVAAGMSLVVEPPVKEPATAVQPEAQLRQV